MEDRLAIIARFQALLKENADGLARTMAKEMGKPVEQGLGTVGACDYRITWFVENVPALVAQVDVPNRAHSADDTVSYDPAGCVGFLPAFNFPCLMIVDFLVPALLCGNIVLMKPSEYGTATAQYVVRLLLEAGLPPDVVLIAEGGPEAGAAVVQAPILDALVFIGSSATGAKVAAAPVRSPRRTVLEMGGNDGFYVHKDVATDMPKGPLQDVAAVAAALATAKFDMMGENCDAAERIYVHEDIYDDFLEAFVATVRGFAVGDPLDEKTCVGTDKVPWRMDLLMMPFASSLTVLPCLYPPRIPGLLALCATGTLAPSFARLT